MRENTGLYRGKRIDNGEWVFGSLLKVEINGVSAWLIFGSEFEVINGQVYSKEHANVIPETVGQYTGLTDKNGKKIFEGDIAREVWGERVYPKRLVVAMDLKRGGWFPYARGDGCGCCEQDVWDDEYTEIIGNIHDNPELLTQKNI